MREYYQLKERKNIRIIVITIFIIGILNMELFYPVMSWSEMATTPYLHFILSGTLRGHIPQKIIIWFLALYPLLLGVESTIQELNLKTNYILISRVGTKKYINNTIKNNIKLPVIAIATGLVINFIVNSIMYFNGEITESTIKLFTEQNIYAQLQYAYPYITVFIVSLLLLFVVSLIAIQGSLFALLFEERKIVYASTFGIYYYFINSQFSITNILQPFDEYGLMKDIIPLILLIAVYSIIIGISYVLVRKKYEKIY